MSTFDTFSMVLNAGLLLIVKYCGISIFTTVKGSELFFRHWLKQSCMNART